MRPRSDYTCRVLVVEDDVHSQAALRSILEEEGFVVAVSGDGREVPGLARDFSPDLIVMDLVLPGMNGIDAVAVLKRDATLSAIPVLAITASWLGSDSLRLRQAGFDGALRKPFAGPALLDAIRRLLEAEPVVAENFLTRSLPAEETRRQGA